MNCRYPAPIKGISPLFTQRLPRGYVYTGDAEKGLYRNCTGTTCCTVCGHYVFLADDVKKVMGWGEYTKMSGYRLQERMFWFKKTLLAAVKCPICEAKWLLHLFSNPGVARVPYNMSFFYSFSEHPSEKDVDLVDPAYFSDELAPHLSGSREQTEQTWEYEMARDEPMADDKIMVPQPGQVIIQFPSALPVIDLARIRAV